MSRHSETQHAAGQQSGPWLDARGAAARALVSEATILRAVRRGALRGTRVGGRKLWRFTASDVDRYVAGLPAPVEQPAA